jgi:hypothetical protein
MMSAKSTGSALLIMMFIMMGLLLYIGTVWRTTSYLSEISWQRQKYEQHYLATYALMKWVLSTCKQEFDTIQQKIGTESLVIDIKKWPPMEQSLGSASIEFIPKNAHTLELRTNLYDGQHNNYCSLSCSLEQVCTNQEAIGDDKESLCHYRIFNWKI